MSGTHHETPRGDGGFRADYLRLCDWTAQAGLALEEMDGLWWWRAGLRRRAALDALRLLPKPPLPAEAAAALRAQAVEEQVRVLEALDRGGLSGAEAVDAVNAQCRVLAGVYGELTRMARSPWWRLGLAARRAAGALGMKKRAFRMPTEDAAEVMALFRAWLAWSDFEAWYPDRLPAAEQGEATAAPDRSLFGGMMTELLRDGGYPLLPHVWRASEARAAALRRQHSPAGPAPLVSVIMAAWNREAVIGDAVRSVLEQTWTQWELLVCDDGSADGTAARAEAAGDPRVRVLRLPHGGAARARNAGLAEARGEHIAYLDTDNLWHPAYLETMLAAVAGRGPVCAFARSVEAVAGAGGRFRVRSARGIDHDYERLLVRNHLDLNTFMHHRALYERLGGFTDALPKGQDWDLALRYTHSVEPVAVDALLALYRRHPDWGQLTDTQRHRAGFVERIVRGNVTLLGRDGLPSLSRITPRPRMLVLGAGADAARARALADTLTSHDIAKAEVVETAEGVAERLGEADALYVVGGAARLLVGHPFPQGFPVFLEDAPEPVALPGAVLRETTSLVLPGLEGAGFPVGGWCPDAPSFPPAGRTTREGFRVLPVGGTAEDAGHFFKRLDMRRAVPSAADPSSGANAVVIGFCGDTAPDPRRTHDAAVLAFASGVSVIAAHGCGLDTLIRRGCAHGVRAGDFDALRTALERLEGDPHLDMVTVSARRLYGRTASPRAAAVQVSLLLTEALGRSGEQALRVSAPPSARQ